MDSQVPGGGNLLENPFVPGSGAHRATVRRGRDSMECVRVRFTDVGYEFLVEPADTANLIGARFGSAIQDRFQELVRIEAKTEDRHPVMKMTVGRPMEVGVLSQDALPVSRLWVEGKRHTRDEAEDILRHCQGSPFGG